MEIFLLFILIVLVVWMINRVGKNNQLVRQHTEDFQKEIQQLRRDLKTFQVPTRTETSAPETGPAQATPAPFRPEKSPFLPGKPALPTVEELLASLPESVEPAVPEPKPAREPEWVATSVRPPAAEPKPSFWKNFLVNNPDLEKLIGENLINKIGIAMVVLGIGYFVKFAIDQEWINEIGRVFIGILAGGLLIGVAHRLRRTFSAFSSVLIGGGLAVLYFTIAIAFHEYQLFSQTVAFLLMVVITGFSIVLSVAYNRVELAVLSLIGGFATPFMVSTGQGNYRVLFTYVLILNAGMLTLTYFKNWRILHVIAYVFTVVLYGGWLGTRVVGVPDPPYGGALGFGTVFYLVFFAMNIGFNLKEKARFSALEISLLVSNTALYYAAGMFILSHIDQGAYQGLFTVAVAGLNFLFAFSLFRRASVDRNLIYLLIGLVITFISLAVPVQLEGNYITMFWALEAVLLLWFAQQSGLTLVAKGSVVVTGLMLVSLAMDWRNVYGQSALDHPLAALLNQGFVTSLLVVVSLLATRRLSTQEKPFNFWVGQLPAATYRRTLGYLLGLTMYGAGVLELNYQLITAVGFTASRTIILYSYHLLFNAGLLALAQRKGRPPHWVGATTLGILGVVVYVLFFNLATMQLLRNHFLDGQATFVGFPFHYLSFGLVVVILRLITRFRALFNQSPPADRLWPWFAGSMLVWVLSAELFFHVIYFNFSFGEADGRLPHSAARLAAYDRFEYLLTQANKVGLPILWGGCAFAFMWVGLNRKNKNLRVLALSLFALTLAKLFIYDIQGISEGGKIAAFISLGVILLVISFMYHKIRKLILTDDSTLPA